MRPLCFCGILCLCGVGVSRGERGLTLLEVLIAAVIAAVVAGGTAVSFATAARMMRAPSNSGAVEAGGYARQTAERLRTNIACDGGWFTADAACAPTAAVPPPPGIWTSDPLPAPTAGVESILTTGARRCYRVASQECDGAAPAGDCLSVEVNVCWNNEFANCPC